MATGCRCCPPLRLVAVVGTRLLGSTPALFWCCGMMLRMAEQRRWTRWPPGGRRGGDGGGGALGGRRRGNVPAFYVCVSKKRKDATTASACSFTAAFGAPVVLGVDVWVGCGVTALTSAVWLKEPHQDTCGIARSPTTCSPIPWRAGPRKERTAHPSGWSPNPDKQQGMMNRAASQKGC